jgi:hypothetical protein
MRSPTSSRDQAVLAADTLLLTIPNQLGVDYNTRLLETNHREIAPAIGWQPVQDEPRRDRPGDHALPPALRRA